VLYLTLNQLWLLLGAIQELEVEGFTAKATWLQGRRRQEALVVQRRTSQHIKYQDRIQNRSSKEEGGEGFPGQDAWKLILVA
jgi:hypothetical protein